MPGLVFLPPNSTETFTQIEQTSSQNATGVLIPLYVYPTNVFTNADYNGIIDLAKQYHRIPITVVLNPSSGPGTVVDGNYTAAIRRLQGAGIKVLGYVHASYTTRPIVDVKADVATWLALYPAIDGLFVDEMTNDDSVPHRAYYTELTQYAHSNELFPVIGNPGSIPGNAYWTQECADVIVVYENSGYPVEATIKGDFDGGLIDIPIERKSGLVYNSTATPVGVRTLMQYVGQIYVTTDTGANPWDTVSTQLGILLSILDVSIAQSSAITSAAPQIGNVGTRANPAHQGITGTGNLGGNTRVSHISPDHLVDIRLAYGNYQNNGGVETDGTNDITVRAAVEYPNGTFIPVYFDGKRDVVIGVGGQVWSDWLPVSIPAATQFWSRTYVTVATTSLRWPLAALFSYALGEGAENSATPTDKTMSGTLSGTGQYGYGVYGIQARYLASSSLRLVGIGDSKIAGYGDTDTLNGWWGRAFDGVAHYQRIAFPQERAQMFAVNTTRIRRARLLESANVAIVAYGINDLSNSRTTAQLQADVISIWRYLALRAIKVYAGTVEPLTTSTDSWTTLANQTISAWDANRTAYNDWLRDGAPMTSAAVLTPVATGTVGALRMTGTGHPLTGYLELADVVESSRNSGKWKVTGVANYATPDGLHPSPAMHGLLAAVPNLPALRAAAVLAG